MQSLKTNVLLKMLPAAVALLSLPSAYAQSNPVDHVSLEGGGGPNVRMARLGVQSEVSRHRWFEGNGRHLAAYWDLSIARWRGVAYDGKRGQHQYITDVGVTPVLRYAADNHLGWYAEGGIGLNLLSHTYNNGGNRLSTAFQFGDHIGAGYVFANGWDLGIKLQHFSNGGIKKPNSGVNFTILKLAMPL